MKRHRNSDMSAEVVSELDAIDATLAGAPVPAEHARLADLARELRASRPAPGQDFVATLDAEVGQGFAGAVAPRGGRRERVLVWKKPLRPRGISPLSRPALAVALTVLVACTRGRGQ